MINAWMDVEVRMVDIVVVDCGYLSEQSARDHADAIFALGVSRRNLVRGPSMGKPRIHVKIPKSKVAKVMAALPISDKKTWYGATHSYL
ncbi:MAG: hypothetical protein MUP81_01730 [Dehalococcoidia bacterium]|nr:hypothetical protein [Dehalococcoidia bacterium]